MKYNGLFIQALILFLIGTNLSYAQDLHKGFPEKFDSQYVLDEYGDTEIVLGSGPWRLKGVKLVAKKKGIAADDDGTKGLQFRSNSVQKFVAEMKFDVEGGVSKVTLLSSSPGEDASCQFVLQASTDGGKTWKKVGKDVLVSHREPKEEVFKVKYKGAVRFRVMKLGLGNPKEDPSIQNGRLIVDNFAVYQ